MPREVITSDEIAPPAGPFSAGVRAGEFLFLSGQVAVNPASGQLMAGDVGAQTEQVLHNLGALLRAVGRSLGDVVRVNVYLTDMGDFQRMNAVYAHHFAAPYPARTTVAVAALPLGAAVEIDCIAR